MKKILLLCFLFSMIFLGQKVKSSIKEASYVGVIQFVIRPERISIEADILNNKSSKAIPSYDPLDVYTSSQKISPHAYYQISQRVLKRSVTGIPGIFCYYKGFVAISDKNGVVTFPRFDQQKKLTVIIATDIAPVSHQSSNPKGFLVPSYARAAWYTCVSQYDQESSQIEWVALPYQSNASRIPSDALVIIADPKTLFFDSEPHYVAFSENLLLPDLFATKELTRITHSLTALSDLIYMSPLEKNIFSSSQQPAQFAEYFSNAYL